MKFKNLFLLAIGISVLMAGCTPEKHNQISTPHFSISWEPASVDSWEYTIKSSGKTVAVKLPVFEIDGKQMPAVLSGLKILGEPKVLRNGAKEYQCEGTFSQDASLHLQVKFRVADDNPVVRFSYTLNASKGQKLTKGLQKDELS